jgi:hypothetical protein
VGRFIQVFGTENLQIQNFTCARKKGWNEYKTFLLTVIPAAYPKIISRLSFSPILEIMNIANYFILAVAQQNNDSGLSLNVMVNTESAKRVKAQRTVKFF